MLSSGTISLELECEIRRDLGAEIHLAEIASSARPRPNGALSSAVGGGGSGGGGGGGGGGGSGGWRSSVVALT